MEKLKIEEEIIRLTPAWVDYRDRAERADHLDGNLNRLEKKSIAPINNLLEKLSLAMLEETPVAAEAML